MSETVEGYELIKAIEIIENKEFEIKEQEKKKLKENIRININNLKKDIDRPLAFGNIAVVNINDLKQVIQALEDKDFFEKRK